MADSDVRALCDEFWQWRMRQSPEFASFCGDQRFSHLLDEIDTKAFLSFESDVCKLLKKAEDIQVNNLSSSCMTDLLLMKDQLQTFQNGMAYKGWYFPINFMEGLHADVPKVISTSPANTEEDFRNLNKRIECYGKKEDLLEYVNHICREEIQPKLPMLFKEFPSSKLRIEQTPPPMASGPAAFYFSGSPDGSRPGVYFIRTTNLKGSPKYELMALSLHEGEPGHHFQTMTSMEMKDIHAFRRAQEDMNYAWVPSRFPLYTAYLEGWGLYCEYLGEELGMYKDNYSLFGRYCMEIMRAARLVVDTGMHAFGWSYEKALNFLEEKTFLDRKSLEMECKRYITIPGQACAYKVGEIKIKQLRQKATEALDKQIGGRGTRRKHKLGE
uniref:Uncharacterized protein n=1 Tax=Magallana gigas TaxID=29159 RepID=K1RLI4_MAGGI